MRRVTPWHPRERLVDKLVVDFSALLQRTTEDDASKNRSTRETTCLMYQQQGPPKEIRMICKARRQVHRSDVSVLITVSASELSSIETNSSKWPNSFANVARKTGLLLHINFFG